MHAYIVVFKTSTKHSEIVTYLKSGSKWGRITDNSYVMVTSRSAAQIRDALTTIASAKDTIFVVKSGVEAAWSATDASNDWLKNNLIL